ncbi:MAG TPA: thioredoxin domain-containing protein [Acidobacteriaceae bacterium]|nr:thioredoxin domain-containing protein [Acidobacteriaceae bacterium]
MILPNCASRLRSFGLFALLVALGCHAQTPSKNATVIQPGVKLSPDLARRVEVMIRNRSQVTPDYTIDIGVPTASEVSGYDQVMINFTIDGHSSKPLPFLISADGKTLAQFNKFDMSEDPRHALSDAGRPARGGPEDAPVLIISFDDLECPFCARMHAELFPAILKRYKDQVRIVYRDFPLDIHPWAMRAAVDANCLAASSPSGYWDYVDYVHEHAAEMGADQKSLAKSEQELDKVALDEGTKQRVNQPELVACVLKQDDTNVKASVAEGLADPLHIGATPTLYINGEKIEGIVPIETIYRVIDRALIAEGKTPPPPVPAEQTQQPTPAQAAPVASTESKPGS